MHNHIARKYIGYANLRNDNQYTTKITYINRETI